MNCRIVVPAILRAPTKVTVLFLYSAISVLMIANFSDSGNAKQTVTGERGSDRPFGYEIETDSKTGWKIIVLKFRDAANPTNTVEARISPDAGSNLYSLKT